jgi:arginine N-succinyltransferase
MFRIRQSFREDVEQVLAVAEHLDTVNLPADRTSIEQLLDRAERSFAGELAIAEREYLFVCEDLAAGRIVGTSMIYAQHGSKRAPHIFFRVENDERYSVTLDRYFVHQTLRIGYNYHGPTEIGGLIVVPEYRRHGGLGKALSYVRFLFMRMHREVFRDEVLSELLPPLEAGGTSKLWEALGRRFTGLTYQEADRLSKDNKEFIQALFPDEPIHTELLADDVRAVIGQVGPQTKAVEAMLRRIGFEYAEQIDPFDGGPHFCAHTDDIAIVRVAREVRVRAVDLPSAPPFGAATRSGESGPSQRDGERWAIIGVETPGARPSFRAIGARGKLVDDNVIALSRDTLQALGVDDGQSVWAAFE